MYKIGLSDIACVQEATDLSRAPRVTFIHVDMYLPRMPHHTVHHTETHTSFPLLPLTPDVIRVTRPVESFLQAANGFVFAKDGPSLQTLHECTIT